MQSLTVGQPFDLGRPLQEGTLVHMTSNGPIIFIMFNGISRSEEDAFNNGQIDMSYTYLDSILFFNLRIEDVMAWSDIPFSIRIEKQIELDFTSIFGQKQGYPVLLVLLDTRTGIVRGLRCIGAGHDFSNGIRKSIEKQMEDTNFNPVWYNRMLARIQNLYSSKQLAAAGEGHFTIKARGKDVGKE